MKTKAVQDLTNVIKQNCKRRSLDELAAEGKKHVRVVSGQKVMRLIEAIVEDAIRRETGEIARSDRDRIVAETRERFDRVMKAQARQEDEIRRLKEEASAERRRAEDLARVLEEERDQQSSREARLLGEGQERVEKLQLAVSRKEDELTGARSAAEKAIARALRWEERHQESERALTTLRKRTEALETEVGSLTHRLGRAADERDAAREQVLDLEAGRDRLESLLTDARARADRELGRLRTEHEEVVTGLREALALAAEQRDERAAAVDRIQAELEATKQGARKREEELAAERKELITRLETERGELAGRQEQALSRTRDRLREVEEECQRERRAAVTAAKRSERLERSYRRLKAKEAAAQATARHQEGEIERLTDELAARTRLLAERSTGSDEETVARLSGELEELKGLVRGVADNPRGPDEETVNALLSKLTEREEQLEGRFHFQMDQTLSEINRALRVATMKPIDEDVEATDVLVGRIFDQESEMRTNLGILAVEARTAGNGISGSLARLREARGATAEAGDETPAS